MNRKRLLIVLLIMIIICGTLLLLNINKRKEIILDEVKLSDLKELNKNRSVAIYLEKEDKTGYEVSTTNEFPSDMIFNPKLSGCINKNGETLENSFLYDDGNIKIKTDGTLRCYLYFDNPIPLGEYLLKFPTDGLNTTLEGGMYRYQGTTNVNNYVCFGYSDLEIDCNFTDVYYANKYAHRIIGIDEDGRVKLIKASSVGMSEWVSEHSDIQWPDSVVYTNVNNYYPDDTIYYKSEWLNKIENYNWNYSSTLNSSGSAFMLYDYEMITEARGPINAKAGGLYLHDYYYSVQSNGINCYNGEGNEAVCKKSWLHLTNNIFLDDFYLDNYNEWTMTGEYYYTEEDGFETPQLNVHYIDESGGVLAGSATEYYNYRPVIYLNSNELYISGSGTIDNPFIIGSPEIIFTYNGISGNNNWYKNMEIIATAEKPFKEIESINHCVTVSETCTPSNSTNGNVSTVELSNNANAQKVCFQTIDSRRETGNIICSKSYKIDNITPMISDVTLSSTASSIKVTVNANDTHSGISKYYYSINNESYISSTSNNYTFSSLNSNTSYSIKVYTVDNAGNQSEVISKTINTKVLAGPYILNKKPTGLNTTTAHDGMYRFIGTTANNYVSLDGILYRIIGITTQTDKNTNLGIEEGQLKLILAEPIEKHNWHSVYSYTATITWDNGGTNVDLYTYLQNDVLNNTSYITANWLNKIDSVKWNVGGVYTSEATNASKIYETESTQISKNVAKIGLMYLSDYYHAYIEGGTAKCLDDTFCRSWLAINTTTSSDYQWTMTYGTMNSSYHHYAWAVLTNQKVDRHVYTVSSYIRPVFYLTKDVYLTNTTATGTSSNPFILGY